MKKIIFIVAASLITMSLSAQRLGVKAGLNLSNYYGDDAEDLNIRAGFQLGALYEVPLSEGLFLQPEVVISLKGAQYSESEGGYSYSQSISPFYLEVPVKVLYKFEVGAGKLTFAAGPHLGLGLFGKAKHEMEGEGESYNGSYNLFTKEDEAEKATFKRFDLGISGAIGYELESGFFVNIETSTGFLSVGNYEDSKLYNNVFAFVAGYKF